MSGLDLKSEKFCWDVGICMEVIEEVDLDLLLLRREPKDKDWPASLYNAKEI